MAMKASSKLHCISLALLFLCGHLNTLQSVTSAINTSTICNTTNNTWAMLSCSSNSWYHVIQELYSPVNNNCSLNLITPNNTLQENSDRELDVSCVGPANSNVCVESVKRSTKNYNEAFVQVTYECINESKIYNLCFKHEVMLEDEGYLASPLMFAPTEQQLFNGCLCEITGVSKAEVLYADVENSNLNITCGTWTSNDFMFLATVVNIDLVFVTKPCTMRIIYRDDDRSNSPPKGRVWIKVSGSNMMLSCSGKSPDAVGVSTITASTTLWTEDTLTMSTTATSSHDRPPSTSSSKASSPDSPRISAGTETTTSTPVSNTSASFFQTSFSKSTWFYPEYFVIIFILSVIFIFSPIRAAGHVQRSYHRHRNSFIGRRSRGSCG